jgi:hypothetical protein
MVKRLGVPFSIPRHRKRVIRLQLVAAEHCSLTDAPATVVALVVSTECFRRDRNALPEIKMAGAKTPDRSYGLSAAEVRAMKIEYAESKRFPDPYKQGAYTYALRGLLALGANEFYPLPKVHEAFKRAAGEEWYKGWINKAARTDNGKDAHGRFLQNLRVLQRTRSFGKRLLEVGRRVLGSKGAVIDMTRDEDGNLLVKLNLDSSKPQKAGRRLKAVAAAAKPKRPKANQNATKARGKSKASKAVPKDRKAGKQP